jgi:uncharacterized protein (DUF2164 family)
MNLHDTIMNLSEVRKADTFLDNMDHYFYREGHRDARHAAAEIVIKADERIEELESALCDILAAHANDNIRPKALDKI